MIMGGSDSGLADLWFNKSLNMENKKKKKILKQEFQ